MTEIQFYHLLSTSLERALPKLLEKAYAGGYRSVVRVAPERIEGLNNDLWTYNPNRFLPHGAAKDGFAEEQPIFLTPGDDNPNNATLLVVTDGSAVTDMAPFARLLDVFDGNDESSVAAARQRWSGYRGQGHTLTYIRQTQSGGWEKMAEAA